MGVLAIFSTGTYAIIGTMCVKSETCYEKYHEKKGDTKKDVFACVRKKRVHCKEWTKNGIKKK